VAMRHMRSGAVRVAAQHALHRVGGAGDCADLQFQRASHTWLKSGGPMMQQTRFPFNRLLSTNSVLAQWVCRADVDDFGSGAARWPIGRRYVLWLTVEHRQDAE